MAKVLVTGATGFIGRRLLYQLLKEGHEVYALSRIRGIDLKIGDNPEAHVIYGDINTIDSYPKDLDAAYYLVHSMGSIVGNLVETEVAAARSFVTALEKTKCKQIIFLGGIIEDEKKLSSHLQSRLAVERELQKSNIPCTALRSSIIIGSGSASFEIIRDLVEKLPMMIAPKWVKSSCQPISIRDVLFYLVGALLNEHTYSKTYDLGGPDAMTFKDILLRYAKFRKLTRFIIDVPVLTPKLSSYWLVLITSVRFSICSYLVESMKQDTRKLNNTIDADIPHKCLSYEEALTLAFQRIAQNEVVSTWMDAWDVKKTVGDIQEFVEVPQEGCLSDVKVIPLKQSVADVQKKVWSIGGDNGWYSMNWAWRLRGLIDQLVGGTGLNRGRRHPTEIQVGDSIDFWRVLLADEKKRHIILFAEMKLPGEAWLEFQIDEEKKTLKQTATFRPKGFFGRIYWYSLFPFHIFIFRNMAKAIAQQP
jgi:uncharacterized protein YbjT (DUF2867 family)